MNGPTRGFQTRVVGSAGKVTAYAGEEIPDIEDALRVELYMVRGPAAASRLREPPDPPRPDSAWLAAIVAFTRLAAEDLCEILRLLAHLYVEFMPQD
jgi:hypothetical protein